MNYYFSTTVEGKSFEAVIDQVTGALKEEGFGVLTEIDVQSTLKKKLDVDFRKYQILGACNPPFAHRALEAEDKEVRSCIVILYYIINKSRSYSARLSEIKLNPSYILADPDFGSFRNRFDYS